jgi:putative ABC transport system substrate-binding protein
MLLSGLALARPRGTRAAERMRRIGILMPFADNDAAGLQRIAAFVERLQALGWSEGRNIRLDVRWGAGDEQLSRRYAGELLALAPDLIVVQSTQVLLALRAVDRTVPVVVANASDLVELGVADSLARPGGNVTGFTFAEHALGGKWVETLKTIAPHVTRVGTLHSIEGASYFPAVKAAGPGFGVEVIALPVRDAAGITDVITAFAREPNGALIVHPGPLTGIHRRLIIALAAKHGLPAIYPYRGFIDQGGLVCYGIDLLELWRSSAGYVDLILRGARPADLPVQSATKIELIINLRTAKALGLAVPPRLLARADEVIQ